MRELFFWALVMKRAGPKDILCCREMARVACDLTSHCWNQLHYRTQIIMPAGCSFSVKITDFLSICGESENRGVLMSLGAEHPDSFPGEGKGRR